MAEKIKCIKCRKVKPETEFKLNPGYGKITPFRSKFCKDCAGKL